MVEVDAAPFAFADVLMRILIEGSTVIQSQPVAVHRIMYRHKVQDRADPRPVQLVHQRHQLRRGTVACGRRIKSCVLVPPAPVEGMFGKRQKLNIVVMMLQKIRDKRLRDFIVGKPLPAVHLPRTEEVDVQRTVEAARAPLHPVGVRKRVFLQIPNNRARARTQLHAEAVGVAMVLRAVCARNHVLVHLSRPGFL